jgi:Cys-rich protein (TIGR01571 family)
MAAKWLNSGWDCCSPCGDCWMACCCPCILHGYTAQRLDPQKGNDESKHDCCNGDCGVFCLASSCGFGWIMTMMRRTEIRNKYGIEGGALGDCCFSCCCNCCAELQMSKEVKQRNEQGAVNSRGFVPQPGMTMEYQPSPLPEVSQSPKQQQQQQYQSPQQFQQQSPQPYQQQSPQQYPHSPQQYQQYQQQAPPQYAQQQQYQ